MQLYKCGHFRKLSLCKKNYVKKFCKTVYFATKSCNVLIFLKCCLTNCGLFFWLEHFLLTTSVHDRLMVWIQRDAQLSWDNNWVCSLHLIAFVCSSSALFCNKKILCHSVHIDSEIETDHCEMPFRHALQFSRPQMFCLNVMELWNHRMGPA